MKVMLEKDGLTSDTREQDERRNKDRNTWRQRGGEGAIREQRIKTVFCNTPVCAFSLMHACLFSVCVSTECKRLEPKR